MDLLTKLLGSRFSKVITLDPNSSPPKVIVHLSQISNNDLPSLINKLISYEFRGLLIKEFNFPSDFHIVLER